MINRKRAVNIYRVSSPKQFTQGDSLDDQKKLCYITNKEAEHELVAEFPLVETGTDKDREDFQRVLDFCKDYDPSPIN
jgi:hypothetical protein